MPSLKRLNTTTLAYYIHNAIVNYDSVIAFIYGNQGAGKTTYALQTLYYIYGDWRKVIRHTYFNREDFERDLNEARKSGWRLEAVLLDDASLLFDKYSWRDQDIRAFNKLFNLIRSECAGVIFTSVNPNDITKYLRERVKLTIHITKISPNMSIATGYSLSTTPALQTVIKTTFKDYVPLYLPDKVRNYYEQKRNEALETIHNEIHQALNKSSTSKPSKPKNGGGFKAPGSKPIDSLDIMSDDELKRRIAEILGV